MVSGVQWWVDGVAQAFTTTSKWHQRCLVKSSDQDDRVVMVRDALPVSHREVVAVETALGAQ